MDEPAAVALLSALAHGTRLRVYLLLRDAGGDGLSAGEVAMRAGVPPTSLSGHLAILVRAGAVSAERRGRAIIHRACPAGIGDLASLLIPPSQRAR